MPSQTVKARPKRASAEPLSSSPSAPSLVRSLGLLDASMLVVGCIVGSGIFRSASSIAAHVTSPSLTIALWIFGGLLSLCGALCYAELAALFPQSGGDYVYISASYGRISGFLFGWTKLFIERTGTIAILGKVFADYLRRALPYPESAATAIAAAAIVLLTVVNIVGVRWGKYVQNLFTFLKIAALAAIIVTGLSTIGAGRAVAQDWSIPPLSVGTFRSLGVALVFVLWTYSGWTEAAYVADEVKEPQRTVPRAILGGLLLTTVLYALVNISYLTAVPVADIAKTPQVAASLMERAHGPAGAIFIAAMIACSAFGALNGFILSSSRVLYAMGKDHGLFARLGVVHPRFRTPAFALAVTGAIAILLVYTKTFDQIATYSTLVISIFFILATFAVIRLRNQAPYAKRPYRAWGYPVTPIVFCLTMIAFTVNVTWSQPKEALFGFGLLALSLPLYAWSQRLSAKAA